MQTEPASSATKRPSTPPADRETHRLGKRAGSSLPDAPVARYAQVKSYLRDGLRQGRWAPSALMPSEAELVAQFGLSRMTVNRALRELASDGLVERVQGVGTFAAQLQRVSSTLTIRNLHDEIEGRGHRHHAELHLLRSEKATAALAARFGVPTGTLLFHSVIVHHENGVPLQIEDRHVNPACAPDYLGVDFTRITPTQYLLDVASLWEAQYTIEATAATARDARLLGIELSAPCLLVVRRTRRRNEPITLVRLTHPGTRYQIEGQFAP